MDLDRDLFVQAFWAKCREVIRPELDRAVDRLRDTGAEAEISSQELDAAAQTANDAGPSLTLTAPGASLSFYGDVARQIVRAGLTGEGASLARSRSAVTYTLDQLDEAEVASIIAAWEAERPD